MRSTRVCVNGRFLLQDVTGVQKVAIEFLAALDELLAAGELPGLDVEVLLPSSGTVVTVPDLKAVRLRRCGRLSGHLWEQFELPLLAGRAPLLCLGNLAPVGRLIRRRWETFTMVHDLSYRYFPHAYSRAFRLLYNIVVPLVLARSTHVFTVSQSELRAILSSYGRIIREDRLTAVQNGGGGRASNLEVTDSPESLEAGASGVATWEAREAKCLYVGSLTRRKNAPGIIRVAEQVSRDGLAGFVVIGSTGPSFEQLGASRDVAGSGQIAYLGQVNDPTQVERHYRNARVFVFPSFYEASPLPPVEAMSFGCPVVCSDIPSLRERCGDGAIYVDPNDHDDIMSKVERLLTDQEYWSQTQARGLARAAQYSWHEQVRGVFRVMVTA